MVVNLIRKEDAAEDIIPWVPASLNLLESVCHELRQTSEGRVPKKPLNPANGYQYNEILPEFSAEEKSVSWPREPKTAETDDAFSFSSPSSPDTASQETVVEKSMPEEMMEKQANPKAEPKSDSNPDTEITAGPEEAHEVHSYFEGEDLVYLREEAKQQGYKAGYNEGVAKGQEEGHQAGYSKGYEEAYTKATQDALSQNFEEALEKGKEEGFQKGHAEGFDAGKVKGHEEGYTKGYDVGVQEGKTVGQQYADKMGHLWNRFSENIAQADQGLAEDLLALAIEIADQVMMAAIEVKPELLLPVVRQAIQTLPQSNQPARIIINPKDTEMIEQFLTDQNLLSNTSIIQDDSIEPGGCKVETESSLIDASLATRRQRVISGIGVWLGKKES